MNWISVKDRLPELGYRYLLATNSKFEPLVIGYRYKNEFVGRDEDGKVAYSESWKWSVGDAYDVTYWMPLPKGPEDQYVHTTKD